MTQKLTIALAQLNPKVGALKQNLAKAIAAIHEAVDRGADIVLFSELFLTGYFPEDLLFKPQFIEDAAETIAELAEKTADLDIAILMPTVHRDEVGLRNAIAYLEAGEIRAWRYKHRLPNDDVFYEKRYFVEGPPPEPVNIRGIDIGLPICEDVWWPEACKSLADKGAEFFLCPNGSPYWRDKQPLRWQMVRDRIAETGLPMIYLNQVGGQDELVFDGASFGMDHDGELVFQGKSFEDELVMVDWEVVDGRWTCLKGEHFHLVSADEAPWRACVLGLRDYIHKNGFKKVVLGLSGGIDSAVVAAMATDALGPENVHCIMLPYRYTAPESLTDAHECAMRLGVRYDVVPIGGPVDAANDELSALFEGLEPDVTEENIQSRMRGVILMAVSNKMGSMLLTTGNKSEMAVGYATIYGDMNGGFNPIKDLLKMQVYHLADWRNNHMPGDCLGPKGTVIPRSIIDKAPSAELRPDQKDQDSLPPYPVLDALIRGLVEEEKSVAEIVAEGFDLDLVKRVEWLIYVAEYKRRQSAPGPKLTEKAFGIGRKYPITNGFRDMSGSERRDK
ncbi:MAG: NAD+ synthase [Hyphomicrobiaceae bacterium]|nr:NAD+ synthase [Hyphomicrobiaceae bacterium]